MHRKNRPVHQTKATGGVPVRINRPRAILLSLAIVLVFISNITFAQKSDDKKKRPGRAGQEGVEQIGTLEVRLPITVKNDNVFVEGLLQRNFEIYEDGKRQTINRFESPSDLRFYIAVLIDVSNSVKLKLPIEKDAAEDFVVTATSVRKKDQVLVASFGSEVELHQDFTDNHQLLVDSIKKLKAAGYTRLYDGVYRVIEEKMSSINTGDARLVMLVLSDGDDTASNRTLKEAIEIAQRYDVTIYGVSTKNFTGISAGTVADDDDKALRELCESTGGQIFLPSQKAELFRSFKSVKDDLRREYVAYYTPLNQDKTGKQREIKVKLVSAKGKSYYKEGYVY